MIVQFTKTLQTYIPDRSTLIVAVSGGPDSIFLLELCNRLKNTHHYQIIVAHVEHGMRGLNSKKDQKFVENAAKKMGLKYETISLKIQKKYYKKSTNLEEAARKERYTFLEALRKKYRAAAILTGHQLNDNIETVLFNLIRGANYNGIKGMEMYSPLTKILRPLLNFTKEEIIHELKAQKIPYRIDLTNFSSKYSRNYIRRKIIPDLKKLNPNFENTFHENLKNFEQINQFLDELASDWLQKNSLNLSFEINHFKQQNPALQKEIIVKIYKQICGSTQKLTQSHLEQIIKLIHTQKSGLQKEFGPDHTLVISRKKPNGPHRVEFISKHH